MSKGTRPILAIPFHSADGVTTVLVARGKKGICFSSEDVASLEFLAAGAASALQMSRQYRSKMNELNVALRAQDRLATLLKIAESLNYYYIIILVQLSFFENGKSCVFGFYFFA